LPALEAGTRVVYMPGRDLALLAAEWLAEGLPADLPCAVVSRAAQPDQQVVHTTLGELGSVTPAAAPSLLIAGWAVRELRGTNDAESAKDDESLESASAVSDAGRDS
jgi:siroheme synthase